MRIISLAFLFFASLYVSAQETANFTQFFVDPYTINPSFAGIEGRAGMHLTYRRQWADFDNAPEIGNFAFHTSLSKNVNFGVNFNNDQRSVLNTSSALITLGYTARLGENTYLRFGASGGIAANGIDLDSINTSDPAFSGILENNAFLIGNAGLSLHAGTFHIGVAIPALFEPQWISPDEFSYGNVTPTERYILTASNRFYFAQERHVFEPYFIYRIQSGLPDQMEAAAIMHLNHTVWFGGTWKQDFGISATGGIKTAKFGVGYSYTFKNIGENLIQSPTHEVTLSLLFGKKKPRHHKYSFVSTVIEVDPEPIVEKKPDPPVEEVKPPVEEVKPPVEEVKPPVEEVKPPVEEVKPPVEEVKPPVEEVKPPVEEVKPPVEEVKPPVEEYVPDVVVKQGTHPMEIKKGNYVIVGAFSSQENAEKFSDDLFMKGYPEAKFGYLSARGYWYVYVHKANNASLSRSVRDSVRKVKLFKDAWTLEVQE